MDEDDVLFDPTQVEEVDNRFARVLREFESGELRARLTVIVPPMPEGLIDEARAADLLQEVNFELLRLHLNSLAEQLEDGHLENVHFEQARQNLNDWRASLPPCLREEVSSLIARWL